MNPGYCPTCQSYLCSCPPLFRKEPTVPEPTTRPEAEAEATAKRGISSLSTTLQALAKIDRILADLDPATVDRVLSFLIGENQHRFKAPGQSRPPAQVPA